MELEMKLKERFTQISAKMEIKNRVDNLKIKIAKENSLSVEDL